MKRILILGLLMVSLVTISQSQIVNQVTITPTNPSPTDTLMIITDFSYHGNCAFGMVSFFSFIVDSTITLNPTYCGYGDTSSCNSVDTFYIGPFSQGNYMLEIMFHQGSICPLSGFDATIASFDTSMVIDSTTGIMPVNSSQQFTINPNPFSESTTLYFENQKNELVTLNVYNALGKLIETLKTPGNEIVIQRKNNPPGIYFFRLEKPGNNITGKLVIQ